MSNNPAAKMSNKEKAEFVKSLDMDAIIFWCKNNNQLPWLEAKTNETVVREYYGYLKAPDPKDGKLRCVKDEYGKRIIDRSKPPRRKVEPIGFMEIKRDFIATFMPELLTEKKTDPKISMKDKLIMALEAAPAPAEPVEG